MDKQAFYRYAGRDLALRAVTEGAIDDMSKTASQGGQIGNQAYEEVNDFAHSLDYVDELQKISEARGMAKAYNTVLEELGQLETADDLSKVAENLGSAVDEIMSGPGMSPQAKTAQEQEAFEDNLVLGTAEGLAQFKGASVDHPEVIEAAVALVENELS